MIYKYLGESGYILIIDNVKHKLRKGQRIELDEKKLRSRKLKQLFKEIN